MTGYSNTNSGPTSGKACSLGITGTPGYLIDGQVYVGHVPATILKAVRK